MPELPEVEVTRRSFMHAIAGASVLAASMGQPLRWPLGCSVQDLVGARVTGVRRRGKYLLVDLDRGILLVHLGMSGSLLFGDALSPRGKHDHFELQTSRGTLRLHDPRRFGAVVFVTDEHDPVARKLLGRLGVEPLSAAFDADRFHQALRQRTAAIKQVLLAGEVVVGVGNIYACEALFLAGIRPTVAANRLSRPRSNRLHTAIVQVLQRAVEQGGTTLRDFSNAQGDQGHFQHETQVYGRAGLPCWSCAQTIKVLRQGQRSTYFCPHCQKR